jgi:hypothetical protein
MLSVRGVKIETIDKLIADGLATVSPERVGSSAIEVRRVKITEAGRRALQTAEMRGTVNDTPTTTQEMQSWNQCEHGSFYFLSWHRMYLYFFDRILRAASGDPSLVLPYWDWTNPMQRTLPVPFRQPANSSNSLFIASPGRPAALNAGTASLAARWLARSGHCGRRPYREARRGDC